MRYALLWAAVGSSVIAYATPAMATHITLRATVAEVTGGGSIALPGGGSRSFQATEIPNFAYQVGDVLQIDWSLSAEEAQQIASTCGTTQVQFRGVLPDHFDDPGCNERLGSYSGSWEYYNDRYEYEVSALGPLLDLQTGFVDLVYDPGFVWLYYCCGYVFDPAVDAFTEGTPEGSQSQTDGAPYVAFGSFGSDSGELTYLFEVDLPGANPANPNRYPAGSGSATVRFDVVWETQVDTHLEVPAPASLALLGLGVLATGLLRRR